MLELWKKQEAALKGLEAGKAFKDVPVSKKVLGGGGGVQGEARAGAVIGGWEVYDKRNQ